MSDSGGLSVLVNWLRDQINYHADSFAAKDPVMLQHIAFLQRSINLITAPAQSKQVPTACPPANGLPTLDEYRNNLVEECAKVAENFPYQMLHMWERPGGPPGNGYRETTHEDIAAAIRALAVSSTNSQCEGGK